ncbi:ligand-binding sensor domain-containing protein [Salinimicrobium terrae]|uniref:ligand-binding sensor domain-containing protein n=1 Tax=Salinimicrobium terrae TaxID=470866 RepID=UPI0004056F77|nr:two-component regulator propeller domain-containing protein [Salinimicrobium terrae]
MGKPILVIFCVISTLTGWSQESGLALLDTITVSHIAQKQGLSQLNVLQFDFDENGYLWAGTEDGLNRFNGYSMKTFSQNNQVGVGLTDDHIRGLLYTNDTLWLGTNTHSVQAYIPSQDRFIHFRKNKKIAADPSLSYAHGVYEIDRNYILISTLKNCILIDRRSNEINTIPLPKTTANDYVLGLIKHTDNDIWLGTYFNGVLNLDLNQMTIEDIPNFDILDNNPVYAFQPNKNQQILIGTEKGLFNYSRSAGKLEIIDQSGEEAGIRHFFNWNSDYYLLGSTNGLKFLNKESYESNPVVLAGFEKEIYSPVEILQIKRDSTNGIWMASQGKGMFYYHPARQKFTPKRIDLKNEPEKDYISIFNFLREKQTLWMTTTIGYVKHDLNAGTYELYRTDRLGYTLVKDMQGQIWGGGFNQGLEKYNRQQDIFKEVTHLTQIPDRDVAEIIPLSKDSIWVSTWSSGIFSVDPQTFKSHPVKINGKELHRSRASFLGEDGAIWLGADDGLYRITRETTSKYEHDPDSPSSLSNNRVFSIAQDNNNNLWIGTAKGLNKLDLKTNIITQYLEQPGLPNDFIYGVLSDNNNDIWVSTNHGLSRLEPDTERFTNFTEQDGLQNNEFNGKAAYKDSLDYLYFGGMNGFNIFHADSIPVNNYVGKTIIENVELFGKPLDQNIIYTDTISFDHDENVITFNYTSLNFLLPEKNRYQFKMLGFDKEWRPVTKERTTTYTNLNLGTYKFMVKGSNNDLKWGKHDSLVLTIRAPWYETTYFRVLLVLVLLLLITSIYFYRYNQKKAENLRLHKMVEGRTAELRRSNEDLSEAINLAQEQKDNIAFLMQELNHRVKNNLQLIASLLDIQKESISDELAKDNLQTAQNRLFTIATIHDLLSAKRPGEFFRLDQFISTLANELILFMDEGVHLDFDLEVLEVHKKCITPLGIIINELVTNTLKHAFHTNDENKKIHISLSTEDEKIRLEYSDNGKGIPKNTRNKDNSLGLNLIENLAHQLKGDLEIEEVPKGTRIIIRFKC